MFTVLGGRVRDVEAVGKPVLLYADGYAFGGAGFTCSAPDFGMPLVVDQYMYSMFLAATRLRVTSVAYTAASPSTMTGKARKAVTVSSTTAVSARRNGCSSWSGTLDA